MLAPPPAPTGPAASPAASKVFCDEATNPANVADIGINSDSLSYVDANGIAGIRVGAKNVHPNVPGYLVVGAGTNKVIPPGFQGTLCIGGPCVGRYGMDMHMSGSAGTFDTDIKAPATACGGGGSGDYCVPGSCAVNIQAGDTWYFQYWHRSVSMMKAQFSSAIEVTFTP